MGRGREEGRGAHACRGRRRDRPCRPAWGEVGGPAGGPRGPGAGGRQGGDWAQAWIQASPVPLGAVGVGGWERALGVPEALWVLSLSPKGFEPRWAGRGHRAAPGTVDCWVPRIQGGAQPALLERGQEPGLEGSCLRGARPPQGGGQGDTPQAPGPELFSTLYHLSVTSWPRSRGHSGYTAALPEAPTQAPPSSVQPWGAHAEAWGAGGSTESQRHPPSVPEPRPLPRYGGETEAHSSRPTHWAP